MDKVSDNASQKEINRFASLWFGGLFLIFLLIGFEWYLVLLTLFGVILFGLSVAK
jgi:hypothetical protein